MRRLRIAGNAANLGTRHRNAPVAEMVGLMLARKAAAKVLLRVAAKVLTRVAATAATLAEILAITAGIVRAVPRGVLMGPTAELLRSR